MYRDCYYFNLLLGNVFPERRLDYVIMECVMYQEKDTLFFCRDKGLLSFRYASSEINPCRQWCWKYEPLVMRCLLTKNGIFYATTIVLMLKEWASYKHTHVYVWLHSAHVFLHQTQLETLVNVTKLVFMGTFHTCHTIQLQCVICHRHQLFVTYTTTIVTYTTTIVTLSYQAEIWCKAKIFNQTKFHFILTSSFWIMAKSPWIVSHFEVFFFLSWYFFLTYLSISLEILRSIVRLDCNFFWEQMQI